MVNVLVTLFDPGDTSEPPNSAILEEVIRLIEQLAKQLLQIQDFRVEAAAIERFG